MWKRLVLLSALVIVASACSATSDSAGDSATSDSTAGSTTATTMATGERDEEFELAAPPSGEVIDFGPAPDYPSGEYSPETAANIETIFGRGTLPEFFTDEQNEALIALGDSEDPRVAWILMDLLRFANSAGRVDRVATATNKLTGYDGGDWNGTTARLIAWDVPAPPGYTDTKKAIYSSQLPAWGNLFESSEQMDWRLVSWGGVAIDDRPFDTTDDLCNCIPAADNPETQPAAEAAWLDDDDVVFGVVIDGEARAYPRQIMEVREMVNDTLGGRDFAMPYCTLCGAAQVWFTDDVPDGVERPVLRTSGLLSRSNKVMYDLTTFSVFDTFLGNAQTGPLAEVGVQLEQHSVVTSTWAEWVAAHPNTDVLIEDLALGRDFDFRSNRDANGPIFPIGDVDPRLAVQEDVLGVVNNDGTAIAFHVESAIATLDAGHTVEFDGVSVIKDGGGVRAVDSDGNDLAAHQAFWFAWSQFYDNTELWPS